MAEVSMELLNRIDALQLGERNRRWKEAMTASGWKLFADREKWTVASWRETERGGHPDTPCPAVSRR